MKNTISVKTTITATANRISNDGKEPISYVISFKDNSGYSRSMIVSDIAYAAALCRKIKEVYHDLKIVGSYMLAKEGEYVSYSWREEIHPLKLTCVYGMLTYQQAKNVATL